MWMAPSGSEQYNLAQKRSRKGNFVKRQFKWMNSRWMTLRFASLPTCLDKVHSPSNAVQSCHAASASFSLINDKLWGTAMRSTLNYENGSDYSIVLRCFNPLTVLKNTNNSKQSFTKYLLFTGLTPSPIHLNLT